jgi:hypothetical protein
MQQLSQERPAAHLPRGLQGLAILSQELPMPPLGQQSQDRRRVFRVTCADGLRCHPCKSNATCRRSQDLFLPPGRVRGDGRLMRLVRPASGITQALASERLWTDGAEVLYDYGQNTRDPAEKDAVGDLIVVRNGQRVFRPIVRDCLRRVTYRNEWGKRLVTSAGEIQARNPPLGLDHADLRIREADHAAELVLG